MQEETVQPQQEKSLEQLLAEAQAKIEEQRDTMMRAVADADNVRKRAQAEAAAALKQLRAALEKSYVREIDPKPGERFDPHRHQAMAAVEAADAEPNTVVAVMQKGYHLHDRVLRPALVTVAKALEKREENPISDTDLD